MQRKRVEEHRVWLSHVEKKEILQKSRGRCAHCGVKIAVADTMTVDHVIPITKGGVNDMSNLVALCETCNKTKKDDVVDVNEYYKFVDVQTGKTLKESFEQYCEEYEFLTKSNVFNKDSFSIKVPFGPKFRRNGKVGSKNVKVTKAVYSDLDEIWEYIVKYYTYFCQSEGIQEHIGGVDEDELKEFAKNLIISWYSKGAIYFTRSSSGKINCVLPSGITECKPSEDKEMPTFKYLYRVGPIYIDTDIPWDNFHTVNYFCSLVRFFIDNIARSISFPCMVEVLVYAQNNYDPRLTEVLQVIFRGNDEDTRENFKSDLKRGFFSLVVSNDKAYKDIISSTELTDRIVPVDIKKLYNENECIKTIVDTSTAYLEKCMLSARDKYYSKKS